MHMTPRQRVLAGMLVFSFIAVTAGLIGSLVISPMPLTTIFGIVFLVVIVWAGTRLRAEIRNSRQ